MSVLKPGTIVSVDYTDFEGNPLHGFFCVLYDEQLDSSNNFKNNFTAIKITTSYNMITNYCIPVSAENPDIFKKDCMALCSKLHTLNKDQVTSVLGHLHPKTIKQIYRCYKRFESELERQMEDYF